jgi:hypothetical protein
MRWWLRLPPQIKTRAVQQSFVALGVDKKTFGCSGLRGEMRQPELV